MQRIEALRYRLDDAGWQKLLTRFEVNRWRGVLIGPHGSGKTTLREELEQRLRTAGWQVRSLVIGDGCAIGWQHLRELIAGADARTLLSIDGLDRIGAIDWWRLARSTRTIGGILATSHVPGRLPTLHHHHTSAALLHDLVRELLHDLISDDPTAWAWFEQRCDLAFARHQGDLRACLRSLYDDISTVRSCAVAS